MSKAKREKKAEKEYTGCSGKNVFFPNIFIILQPLLRKNWALLDVQRQIGKPMGVTSEALRLELRISLAEICR